MLCLHWCDITYWPTLFYPLHFVGLHRYCIFYKLKVCGNPVSFFQQCLLTFCLCVTFRYFSEHFSNLYYICYGVLWSVILKKYIFIYLFLTVLGLHCCTWAFSTCREWDLLSTCGARTYCNDLSCWVTQALGHAGFSSCGLRAPGNKFNGYGAWNNCSAAWGNFLDQRWNQCALRCKSDSLPLGHQGSPIISDLWCYCCNCSGVPWTMPIKDGELKKKKRKKECTDWLAHIMWSSMKPEVDSFLWSIWAKNGGSGPTCPQRKEAFTPGTKVTDFPCNSIIIFQACRMFL